MITFEHIDNPLNDLEWTTHNVEIKNGDQTVFKQDNVVAPKDWSTTAVTIAASKYFYRGEKRQERSILELVQRVVSTITARGVQAGYFDTENGNYFYDKLCNLLLEQKACFNSPVLFNVGLHLYGAKTEPHGWFWKDGPTQCENAYAYPQISACFIQDVQDNMQSIMDLAKTQAMLFKYGSGTGTNFSTLRSYREGLSEGGKPSGPLSFMQIYDKVAGVVSSGGKTRRAASMRILDMDHPDIMEFINCKAEVENLARDLMNKGHASDLVYNSLSYQNANHSVRIPDSFMEALGKDAMWYTKSRTGCGEMPKYKASELWNTLAQRAWECGDPGVQFHDTINAWNTCKASGEQTSTNPCGEFSFLPNTSCNLASINLRKFQTKEGTLKTEEFKDACRTLIIAMDILVDLASYPTAEICRNSHCFRPLGLGYTNFGAYLMAAGIPYDSKEGRNVCREITATMLLASIETSTELAKDLGTFEEYEKNKQSVDEVLEKHADYLPEGLQETEIISEAKKYGLRNAQLTLLAPTGTISFVLDCDTTGIEPEFALVKTKQLVGGGSIKTVNKSIIAGLEHLGYTETGIKKALTGVETTGKLNVLGDHYKVFQTALGENSLPWEAHVSMMAAAQPFLSGAISKTINLPANATVEDTKEVFKKAYELGLKSITVYRDGSKGTQPLTAQTESKAEPKAESKARKKLPDTRRSVTHKFIVDTITGYFTVGLYEDGTPGELFISVSKEGSTISGLLDSFGISISMGLQYGIPLGAFIEKFKHTRFEPQGWTPNKDIRFAKSIMDYIFRWLELEFVSNLKENPCTSMEQIELDTTSGQSYLENPICSVCGSITMQIGACHTCPVCGTTTGCS